MIQAVRLDVFYPYPPERVWQVLTDRRALADWMMDNDFEPKLGHKFRFHSQPLPEFTTTIYCEVVELEEPNRLSYTWRESLTTETSVVIWTLTPVAGGTQLHLKHQEYSYTTAIAQAGRNTKSFLSEMLSPSILEAASLRADLDHRTQSNLSTAMAFEFSVLQMFDWDYFLNQKLSELLAQD